MEIHCDGFTFEGNPSKIGGGWSVLGDGIKVRVSVEKEGMTNNEVELRGLLRAAMEAQHGDTLVSDSEICLSWVSRGRSGSRPDLLPFSKNAHALIRGKDLKLEWSPRGKNLAGIWNDKDKPKWKH